MAMVYYKNINEIKQLAIIEAKAYYKNAGDGIQQAKKYAEILGFKFAYSASGQRFIEHVNPTAFNKYNH